MTVVLETLIASCRGRVIGVEDADYDTARQLFNAMIDKRPRLIARCLDAADLMAAVNAGREQGPKSLFAAGDTTVPASAASTTDSSSTCPTCAA